MNLSPPTRPALQLLPITDWKPRTRTKTRAKLLEERTPDESLDALQAIADIVELVDAVVDVLKVAVDVRPCHR